MDDDLRQKKKGSRRDGKAVTVGKEVHMKKNRWFLRMMVLLLLSGILSMTIALAAEPGSDGDPLVTLSYLNDTFMKSVMDKVDQKISARNSQLAAAAAEQLPHSPW